MTIEKKIIFFFLIDLFLFFLLSRHSVLGQTSITESVNATVKISICGNGIAEGGEDCDNSDLGGGTCVSLGYTSGTLSCDIACDFNTSGCSTTPDSTVSTETTTSEQTTTSTPIVTSLITHIPPTIPFVSTIPQALIFFDLNKSGVIEVTEIFTAVKSWVDEWRNTLIKESAIAEGKISEGREVERCDVNDDDKCDLVDLSILLYYIEK